MDEKGHCDRFNELSDATKEFLEHLTPEKIASIEQSIEIAKNVKIMGKFWRWIFYITVSVAGGAYAIGNAVDFYWRRLRGN